MKVGDLVIEVTRMKRTPAIGVVIEIDDETIVCGAADHLVTFYDGHSDWMAEHHLTVIGADVNE